MFSPPPRRWLWLSAALLVVATALGVGLAVSADRSANQPVLPYDPLPRW